MSQALLQPRGGERRARQREQNTQWPGGSVSWEEWMALGGDAAMRAPLACPAPVIKRAGAGLPRAWNAERSRAAREGSLVKEDMSGVRRRVELLRAGTLESVGLGSDPR